MPSNAQVLLASTSWSPAKLEQDSLTTKIYIKSGPSVAPGLYLLQINGIAVGSSGEFIRVLGGADRGKIEGAPAGDPYTLLAHVEVTTNGMSLIQEQDASETVRKHVTLKGPFATQAEGSGPEWGKLVGSEAIELELRWVSEFRNSHTGIWMINSPRGSNHTEDEIEFDLEPSSCGTMGCESDCGGMITAGFEAVGGQLVLQDSPIPGTVPFGPLVDFSVRYSESELVETDIDVLASHSNLGTGWSYSFLSYIAGGPVNNKARAERYTPGNNREVYTHYDPTTGEFDRQMQTRSALSWEQDNDRYVRTLLNGGEEVFAHSAGPSGKKIYLITERSDPQGNKITFQYDSQNRLTSVTDVIGRQTQLSYEIPGDPMKISRVKDRVGTTEEREARITYDGQGRLESITDVIDLVSWVEYGSNSLIEAIVTPYGRSSFSREDGESYRALTITDPKGYAQRVEYRSVISDAILDALIPVGSIPTATGFVAPERNSLKYFNTFYWDREALHVADGAGESVGDTGFYQKARWMRYAGGPFSVPVVSKRALENPVFYNYESAKDLFQDPSVPSEDQDPYGSTRVIHTDQDTLPRPTKVVQKLDGGSVQVRSSNYNERGATISSIDPIGREIIVEYGANGVDATHVKIKDGSEYKTLVSYSNHENHLPKTITGANGQNTSIVYNLKGQPTSVTNPKGEVATISYYGPSDPAGLEGLLKSIDGALPGTGDTFAYAYDVAGRLKDETDVDGYTTSITYDKFDRIVTVTYEDNTTNKFAYDKLDLKTATDRKGRTSTFFFNALRQLKMTQDPEGRFFKYSYCRCGDMKSLIDANGNETKWVYDLQGRLIKKLLPGSPDNDPDFSYTYDDTGRLKTVTDKAGNIVTHTYSSDDRVLGTTYTEGVDIPTTPDISFAYDSVYPRRASMTDGTGTTNYTYYTYNQQLGSGRLHKVDGPLTGAVDEVEYIYDKLGRAVEERKINGSANINTVGQLRCRRPRY